MTATATKSEYHDNPPLPHDFYYHIEDGAPVLDND